jgi:hypothetical protein
VVKNHHGPVAAPAFLPAKAHPIPLEVFHARLSTVIASDIRLVIAPTIGLARHERVTRRCARLSDRPFFSARCFGTLPWRERGERRFSQLTIILRFGQVEPEQACFSRLPTPNRSA